MKSLDPDIIDRGFFATFVRMRVWREGYSKIAFAGHGTYAVGEVLLQRLFLRYNPMLGARGGSEIEV